MLTLLFYVSIQNERKEVWVAQTQSGSKPSQKKKPDSHHPHDMHVRSNARERRCGMNHLHELSYIGREENWCDIKTKEFVANHIIDPIKFMKPKKNNFTSNVPFF